MKKDNEIDALITECEAHNINTNDIAKIKEAAIFAKNKHEGQFRKSGEPYIIHPIATARILLSWKMDVDTIITGLLHDVLEDTKTTEQEIIDKFGFDIYKLVSYVTKVNLFSKENRNSKENNEYLIQVLLSMSHDIRAMIVKLADRFHNMTTINFLPVEKQLKIANETLNIYAKVAGRLGMYRLKTNLLDMSFKIIDPKAYEDTKQLISGMELSYKNIWDDTTNTIIGILDSYSIKYEIKARTKGIYSTYEKLTKGYNIKDIHDIYAIRIITDNNLNCYTVLGLVHLNFIFIAKAFKDYISIPKFNYYQSLHTTIIKKQALIEIQIRTKEMDMYAEYGVAAHWNYKDNNKTMPDDLIVEGINNLSEKTFSNIKTITNDIIFTITILNNGKNYTVNNKTRCIDLAFQFDNNKFKYLDTIIVNGKLTSFDSLLHPLDVIRFTYKEVTTINKNWLKFTTFQRTINGINDILNNLEINHIVNESEFLENVRNYLKDNYIGDDELKKKIKKKLDAESISNFLEKLSPEIYNSSDFYSIFDKRKQIRRKAFQTLIEKNLIPLKLKKEFYFDKVEGLYFSDLQFPKCCNKVPGVNVVGKLDRDNVLRVHNCNCKEIKKIRSKIKLFPLTWNAKALLNKPRRFSYFLELEAVWTPSIGNIISSKIMKYNNLINEIIVHKIKNTQLCNVKIVVYTSNIKSIKASILELSEEINIKSDLTF